ncbi:MAG: NUDIX hydrolase [Blastocatellia bacterium]|nr:NUDIX hydrolase [Blastocatellia bacterium]
MTDKYANPWQTLSTRLIYQNAWIRVREDQVIQPDGVPGIYGVVEFHGCVGVLPIDAEGNVHLVGQFRYPLQQYSWEIPEGGCHPGEAPLEAARRELMEELGLETGHLELLGISHLSNSVSDETAYYYVATNLTQGEATPEGSEQLEHRIVPFAEALRMVLHSEITDSLSQIAILHYAVTRNAMELRTKS